MPNDNRLDFHSTYDTVPVDWLGTSFIDLAEHLKEVDPDAYEHEYLGIANVTGGKYFRATDSRMLRHVFEEIDALEKSKINVNNFTQTEENFMPWILGALCALSLFLLIRYTVLRRIP